MRLFVAVDLAEEIKQKIGQVLQNLAVAMRSEKVAIQWVRPEQFHFTLKFLGECKDEQFLPLTGALQDALKGTAPFSIHLGELGYFPEKGPIRIIWLGLREGHSPMEDLAARIEAACAPLGFPKEERPFSAHLTLGRVKSCRNPDRIRAFLAASKEPSVGSVKVNGIRLIRSILSSAGPAYTVLKSFPLQ